MNFQTTFITFATDYQLVKPQAQSITKKTKKLKIIIMELASKYNPADVEGKWYQYWLDNKLFSSKPDGREPYTVVIPPPNVTGVLHMGHMLNNTIQDILVRRARMMGKNAFWVPGTETGSAGNKEDRSYKRGVPETRMGMD